MKLLDKVRSYMLGTAVEDDEEEFYEDDDYMDSYDEEPRYYKKEREQIQPLWRKSNRQSESKVVNMPTQYQADRMQVTICKPVTVDDATSICDYLKTDIICIVNLEGVERQNAQRIADFLGGSCYALGGEIQRVNNEIFLIAPTSVGISSELRDELRESGLILPWLTSSFR